MIAYNIVRLLHDCITYCEGGSFDGGRAVAFLKKILDRSSDRLVTMHRVEEEGGVTSIFVNRRVSDVDESTIIFEGTDVAMRPLVKLVVLLMLSSPRRTHVSDHTKRLDVIDFLEPDVDPRTRMILSSPLQSDREFMGVVTCKIEDPSLRFPGYMALMRGRIGESYL